MDWKVSWCRETLRGQRKLREYGMERGRLRDEDLGCLRNGSRAVYVWPACSSLMSWPSTAAPTHVHARPGTRSVATSRLGNPTRLESGKSQGLASRAISDIAQEAKERHVRLSLIRWHRSRLVWKGVHHCGRSQKDRVSSDSAGEFAC